MRFIHPIMFYDFKKVLHINRRHHTKNEYFPMHILFTTIYLFQEHKLNHRNYSKQEINMSNFYNILRMMCTCMKNLEV
jgi:hypothetical protein